MGADISRVRFDARNDYNGVVTQQGRVRLDADDNEQSAITDRRLRAQTADLGSFGLGDAGVAVIPRTTPDAFKLSLVGGKLTLGRGRIYVDGILAENHGTGAVYDPLLAELTGDTDGTYDTQPYLPSPPALPTKGTHLIYLDVWERELTPDQRPDLVEPALGVDTTARTQVVWQVRAHAPDTPGIDCSTPSATIQGWSDLIAPPTARLTVGTQAVTAADDPCSLPPAGGYRGLENQTYRVQIHTPGAAGAATFTWSRDNGSVAVAVTEVVSTTQLRLASLGKDTDFLGIKTGDWVEIIDDAHELSGSPGELRHVTVHKEDMSISFDTPPPGTVGGTGPLPAGWPTTTADAIAGHLRVRRWDGTDGETTIDATPILLEHGITVTLTAGTDGFRTGQYWTFAARTATADVEQLTDAPPLGPKHHYARLGVIDFATPAVVSAQCPPLWPPDSAPSCDTVTVCPDQHESGHLTLQQAIDTVVKAGGGSICLCAGTFSLDAPLKITEAHGVWLRGQGAATVIQAHADVIDIAGSDAVAITDMRLVSDNTASLAGAGTATAVIRLQRTRDVALERLALATSGDSGVTQPYGKSSPTYPSGSVGVGLLRTAIETRIRDCHISADLCVTTLGSDSGWIEGLEVSGSTLNASTAGVHLEQVRLVGAIRIRDNAVVGGTIGLNLIADASEADVTVYDNDVSEATTGIAVADSGYNVARNSVAAPLQALDVTKTGTTSTTAPVVTPTQPPQAGATKVNVTAKADLVTKAELIAKERIGTDATLIKKLPGNTDTAAGITARTHAGNAARETRITGNSVTGFPVGILAEISAGVIVIEDNQVTGSDMVGIGAAGLVFTHAAVAGTDLTQRVTVGRIANNVVSQIGGGADQTLCAGIYAIGFENLDIAGNLVATVGSIDTLQPSAGALVFAVASAMVAGNTFRDVAAAPKETEVADMVFAAVSSLSVLNNTSSRTGRLIAANTIGLMIGDTNLAEHAMAGIHATIASQPIETYKYDALTNIERSTTAKVAGNSLLGGPGSPAVFAQVRGVALFADNHFTRAGQGSGATARISANSLAFSNNHATGRDISAQLTCAETDKYTILGNLTEGEIQINGAMLAGAWAPLNVSGVV